jgi:hypothetical protein
MEPVLHHEFLEQLDLLAQVVEVLLETIPRFRGEHDGHRLAVSGDHDRVRTEARDALAEPIAEVRRRDHAKQGHVPVR